MTDDIIRLPADSTGKRVDTESLTVGSNTVYRSRIQLAGSADVEIVEVTNSNPAGTEYGLIVRNIPSGSQTVDAPVNTPANVQVGDGTNTATIRDLAANDALNVAIVDGSGDQITSFGGGTEYAEDDPSAGGESLKLAGAVREDSPSATTSLDGDYTYLKTDSESKLWVNASGETLTVDGSAVTQPISAASLPLPTGAATEATLAGTLTVDITDEATRDLGKVDVASLDQYTPVSGRLPVDGSGVTQPVSAASLPLPTGAATEATLAGTLIVGGVDASDAAITGDPVLTGARASTATPTAVDADGDAVAIWADRQGAVKTVMVDDAGDSAMDGTNNALRVNVVAGGGAGGGTSLSDDSAFTAGTTALTPVGGTYQSTPDSVDDGDSGAFRMTQTRALYSTIETPAGDSAMDDTNDAVRVNIVAGSGSGTEYAEDDPSTGGENMTIAGAIREDSPSTTTSLDGDYSNLKVDSAGRLWTNSSDVTQPISAASLPLPTGAATEATLSSIDTAVNGTLTVDGSAVTQPISHATLAVTGGGTETGALRVTIANNSTGVVSIDDGGNVITVDGTVAVSSVGGTVTVDGSGVTQPISAASLPLPAGAATEATLGSIDTSLSGTLAVDVTDDATRDLGKVDIASFDVELPSGTQNIGDVDIASVTPVTASGSLTAADQSITLDVGGYGGVAFQLSGTWTATVGFDGTVDGINWFNLQVVPIGGATQTTTTTNNGIWFSNVGGLDQVRIYSDSHSSGTIVVDIQANISASKRTNNISVTSLPNEGQQTMANSISVAIASNQSAVVVDGSAVTQPVSATSLPLPAGAATEATLGSIDTALAGTLTVDGSGVTQPVSGTINANAGTGDFLTVVGHTRNEAFKESSAIGGELDDTGTTAATEGNVSPVRITAQRALHTNLRDASGNELGVLSAPVITQLGDGSDLALVTAAGELNVIASAQPGTDIGDVTINNSSITVDQGSAGTAWEVIGDVAADATAPANPLVTGGQRETMADSAPGTRTSTDTDAEKFATTDGAQYVITTGPQTWDYHEDSSSTLTDASVHSAPGAGLSLYVTDIVFSTGAATACNVFFEESTTTVLGPYYLEGVAGRGLALHFTTPKKITANTALTVTTSAAIAHSIDVMGFVAPG